MSAQYLKELAERAIKTFCQALAATLTAGAVDVISVPWVGALSTAAMAALLSVLTSIGSAGFGNRDTPSLVTKPDEGSKS